MISCASIPRYPPSSFGDRPRAIIPLLTPAYTSPTAPPPPRASTHWFPPSLCNLAHLNPTHSLRGLIQWKKIGLRFSSKKHLSFGLRFPTPKEVIQNIYWWLQTWVGLTLIFMDRCLPDSAWAELAGPLSKIKEHLNQSQPNPGFQPSVSPCSLDMSQNQNGIWVGL